MPMLVGEVPSELTVKQEASTSPNEKNKNLASDSEETLPTLHRSKQHECIVQISDLQRYSSY